MLMAITIGTLAASAQSSERRTSRDADQRKSTAVDNKRSQTVQRTNTAKNTKKITPSKSSYTRPDARKQVASRTVQSRPVERTKTQASKSQKVSTTNRINPKSDYRTPEKTLQVNKTLKDVKGSNTTYKSTSSREHTKVVPTSKQRYVHKHSRVIYPNKRVTIHVHPFTYKNHYRVLYYPAHRDIIWTRRMHNYYVGIYPGFSWHYHFGYSIQTISAFDAIYNVGEIKRVYGRVYATWYNRESDDLLLFFGGEFPNQEFTLIVPGSIARRYSWRPEKYFLGQHVLATGLITVYEGSPEIIIKRRQQFELF